jgi:hypothetical protein
MAHFSLYDAHPFNWLDKWYYIMPFDGNALMDSYLVYPYLLGHGSGGVTTSPNTAIFHSDIQEGF